ncbi:MULTISPECIES: CRISPR-associated protein Cas4 [Cylindrospermopsis]|uniref:CRISPR-associated exonuclease Cas4 n=1 Tax=Cylindrospermopsis curvispora GIHE-G1 TaxID=2666332 RepID=A0A7H0F300_9CYAN|nr:MULTISPECIES: CRISPR-associated protein Cas4 [Cylindrospermopsis]KRH98113.1 CRISPR-associated protein Cas4 [Cylindrospermopsis sp. CR12]MBU6345171.1 CRISPR-associated protein Cas4 [Cyanobacteria bacterium REEB494]QNP30416.1 CRISPR-associated protein Cas4 [Cylindrospermopsis curvispora GIHE-G1]
MNDEQSLVPIAAINNYNYCPRCCWYIYVTGEWQDNEFTIAGTRQHERVDSGEFTSETNLKQWRSLPLYSYKLGLIGKADLVEQSGDEIYPVEYKVGYSAKWQNDHLQLCAQTLALEEMLNISIPKAFMYYAASHQRLVVDMDDNLRRQTIQIIQEIREMLVTTKCPPNNYQSKCKGCSLYDICLPKETEKARLAAHDI